MRITFDDLEFMPECEGFIPTSYGDICTVTLDTEAHTCLIHCLRGKVTTFFGNLSYGGGIDHADIMVLDPNSNKMYDLVVWHNGRVRVNFEDELVEGNWMLNWRKYHSTLDMENLRKQSFGCIGFATDVKNFLVSHYSFQDSGVRSKDFSKCVTSFKSFRDHLAESRPSSAWWFYHMTDEEFKDFIQYSWDECE